MSTNSPEHCLNWVEINKLALTANIHMFLKRIKDKKLMAVVKANAYGHGIIECANIVLAAGAHWLGVNSIEEGLILRKNNIKAPILVLGRCNPTSLESAIEGNLDLTIYDTPILKELSKVASSLQKTAQLHLKVETGLHRQGLLPEDLPEFSHQFHALPNLKLRGVSTHYANIEDTLNDHYAEMQIANYHNWLEALKATNLLPEIKHTSCSAGAILYNQCHFDMVRAGISIYGLWPSRETRISALSREIAPFTLQPVLTWYTRIAQIKTVAAGSFIGYGCQGYATRETKIAIIPTGYYEGYSRALSSRSHVIINEKRCPTIGRICMNMTLVDVSHIDNATAGDKVILLGGTGNTEVTAEELAGHMGTINYEVVTSINSSLPRFVV